MLHRSMNPTGEEVEPDAAGAVQRPTFAMEFSMPRLPLVIIAGALLGGLSACGHNVEQRAATGAVAGAVVGGPVGAAAGAAAGTAVSKTVDK